MRKLLFISVLSLAVFASSAQSLPVVDCVDLCSGARERFVRVAQFQLDYALATDQQTGLSTIADVAAHEAKIERCLELSARNGARIVLFPELCSALPADSRERLFERMQRYAVDHDAIVLGGTYYDSLRRGVCPIFAPEGRFSSYKLNQSIFETSAVDGRGMVGCDTLRYFRTRWGNFVPVVCVDLISDDVNYLVRRLSNTGDIDMLFNLDYNPASREFLREVSSIVRRHPLFASIVNVAGGTSGPADSRSDGRYGNSALVGALLNTFRAPLVDSLPASMRTDGKRSSASEGYEMVLSVLEPSCEGALVYELNLRVVRPPSTTNAPDQGYPTVRNVKRMRLGNGWTEASR